MQETNQHIKWADNCVDPGSRVLFIGERVYRAFEEQRKQEVLEFINSECFSFLRSKDMIVESKIAENIHIDGYPLIIEHERLQCMPEEWYPFEMLKDILAFHFEINAICRSYGYGVRDIGYGNVTLKNGHLCFLDFGSFRKIENIDINVYEQYCLPLAYMPLALFAANDGNDYLAECFIKDYDNWQARKCYPSYDTLLSDTLAPYLYSIVDFYIFRIKKHNLPIQFRKRWSLKFALLINHLAKNCFPHRFSNRSIIKVIPSYSERKAEEVLNNVINPNTSYNPEYNKNSFEVKSLSAILQKANIIFHTVILWGNFPLSDIIYFCNQYKDCSVIVMSNDRAYTNTLYNELKNIIQNVFVICTNVMKGKDNHILSYLKADLMIVQKDIWNQTHIGTHSDWAEKASYSVTNLLIQDLDEDERNQTKFDNFWFPTICKANYSLFSNRHNIK